MIAIKCTLYLLVLECEDVYKMDIDYLVDHIYKYLISKHMQWFLFPSLKVCTKNVSNYV